MAVLMSVKGTLKYFGNAFQKCISFGAESMLPLFVFPLSYCIKCQALKMEVEIRDAAADLKAYKYRRRSSFPYPKRVKKGSLPLLLYTTT